MADALQSIDQPPLGAYPYRFTQDDRHQYRVKVQPAGECLEFVVRSVDTERCAAADYRAWAGLPKGKRIEPLTDRDREDLIRRSTERAKRMVRLLSLELGADRLLTFTTRDTYALDKLQVMWDRFVRMARTFDPSFAYIAVPEPHKDHEHWHIHAAYKGWININVVRRMWHAAIHTVSGRGGNRNTAGACSPGNVDVQYRGRAHGVQKTRRIAGYIAKYITKGLIERFNKKRYWHTKGVTVPEAQRRWLEADNMDDAVRETMRAYGLLVDDQFPVCKVWKPGNLAFFWIETSHLDPPPF
jgi:hypothetical protein